MTTNWTAKWIWQDADGPVNTWMCFRKTVSVTSVQGQISAYIAVDSKYWLWINGQMVVFEGGLNRGPTPTAGYYDKVDIHPFLVTGHNTIAILTWYWGNEGRNNSDSGKGGLLFQVDLDGATIESDSSWKIRPHPAYGQTDAQQPSYLYGGHNISFDARRDQEDWHQIGYDDSEWSLAVEKGIPPCAPWLDLWERPVPLWKDSGLQPYLNSSYTRNGTQKEVAANLPYAAHITPYLKIKAARAGEKVDIRTDRYLINGGPGDERNLYQSHRTEYITREGVQEFESLNWLFGESVLYTMPQDVEIVGLSYRETGYDTQFAGTFYCNDEFYNQLYEKSKRTLYICMRDNFMDCPDRERGQWIGDVSSQVPQVFYSLDMNAHKLLLKAIRDFVNWSVDGVLRGNVPGSNCTELPSQSLNAISDIGMIMSYYMNSGDLTAISESFTAIKNYLYLWSMGDDGLIDTRTGDWNWFDHGDNIDAKVLENAWYYMALKAAETMAKLTGNTSDIDGFRTRKESISGAFDRMLWKGDGYRSGIFNDDRANAMAVLSGLADGNKQESIKSVLTTVRNASPYMEGYILEALFCMGYDNEALQRMKDRYWELVANPNTTLWEDFSILGTKNHAWSGRPLALLCQYVAGVAPVTAGYGIYHVLPQMGQLGEVSVDIPCVKGNITVSIRRDNQRYVLNLTSPADTTAIVGIPKNAFHLNGREIDSIKTGGDAIWSIRGYQGHVPGVSWNGENDQYIKFNVGHGRWDFVAEPF